jgi:hypothetical protein
MSDHEDMDGATAAARAMTPEAFMALAKIVDDEHAPQEARDAARQVIFDRMDVLRWVSTDPAHSEEDRAAMAALVRRFNG